jgi:hypothetical protein
MRLLSLPLLLALLVCAFPLLAEEFDDCDANFIAFIGSSAYQFSPNHPGELGTVRLFSILSYQRAAHEQRFGFALWQLRIDRVEDGARVMSTGGRAFIGRDGAAVAEFYWDGRDDAGRLVPAGKYRYTFVARYLADRFRRVPDSYDAVFDGDEALASSDEVIVNYDLPVNESRNLRLTAHATNCQVQQHAPMEAGFAYNFYYGSTHAHSNWSDGGQPTSNCNSGNTYGSGTFAPADVFNYARTTALLDYWVVNEHNHLINDASATNDAPVTEAKVRQRYQNGLAAANTATVSGSFVALYGMEWGVSTNDDQGHVTFIETPALFGWETCTTCNGPNPECTPGTNCYFDVFTPKRFGYLAAYAASVANPSFAGALGIFNHPGAGNFDNLAFNANADNAMQGMAVRSGLAFATATDCGTVNVGSTDYTGQWKEALNKGFHLAPAADHDSHCNNYGVALPTRTVYLASSLTKADLLAAQRARHFFATEDPNVQLVFRTSDSAHIMGDIFNAAGGATLVANLYDPDGESFTTIELWRGQIGGGVPASPYATWSNVASATKVETLTSGSYYYFVHAVQADGHDVWSAPMWITYQAGGGDTTPPTTSITAPSNGTTVSGTTNVTATASDNVGVTRVEFLLDGALQSTDTSSPYAWSWNTASVANGVHVLVSKAYDAANNFGTSVSVSVTVNNAVSGGADVSGWSITQANAAGTYTIPAGTVVPAEGYLVIARDATKSAFETFWARTLGSNVVFLNSAGVMPVINGDENFTLKNASAVTVDGPTSSQPATAAKSVQRVDPCGTSWNTLADTSGNPGSGAGAGCGGGVKLNEHSDASGTGNFIYEFLELHNDSSAPGTPINIGGYTLTQANATLTYTIPTGTTIPSKGYVIVGRNATKAQFEAFWGVTLGSNVIYLNAADTMPQINGSETYTLKNGATTIDGATVAMATAGGESLKRLSGCSAAGTASSWTRTASSTGNPGAGGPATCNKGVFINEFSDALGTGNFIYEFVELYNDK